jgi:hypothetical protein
MKASDAITRAKWGHLNITVAGALAFGDLNFVSRRPFCGKRAIEAVGVVQFDSAWALAGSDKPICDRPLSRAAP